MTNVTATITALKAHPFRPVEEGMTVEPTSAAAALGVLEAEPAIEQMTPCASGFRRGRLRERLLDGNVSLKYH